MAALRIATPDRQAAFVDLGPQQHVPLRGATLRGHAVVGEHGKPDHYGSTERVRAFRERHGGRKAAT